MRKNLFQKNSLQNLGPNTIKENVIDLKAK